MEDVKSMTSAELIKRYNELDPEHPVKRFSTLDAGRRRVKALLDKQAAGIGQLISKPKAAAVKKGDPRGRKGFKSVKVIEGGNTVLQKESKRRKVFDAIAGSDDKTASVDFLDKKLGFGTRPYILKMLVSKHVKIFDAEGKEMHYTK